MQLSTKNSLITLLAVAFLPSATSRALPSDLTRQNLNLDSRGLRSYSDFDTIKRGSPTPAKSNSKASVKAGSSGLRATDPDGFVTPGAPFIPPNQAISLPNPPDTQGKAADTKDAFKDAYRWFSSSPKDHMVFISGIPDAYSRDPDPPSSPTFEQYASRWGLTTQRVASFSVVPNTLQHYVMGPPAKEDLTGWQGRRSVDAALGRATSGRCYLIAPETGTYASHFTTDIWPELIANGKITEIIYINPATQVPGTDPKTLTKVLWKRGDSATHAFPLNKPMGQIGH